MGAKSGESTSESDYLLYATICMVGLPVEIQVKDGSLYSGIFHTASFNEGHGIVMKKARKIGKGRHEKGSAVGSLIDTLVIFSADLVQVVVKDFLLPAEHTAVNVADAGVVAGTIELRASDCDLGGAPELTSSNGYPSSQVGEDMQEGEATSCAHVNEVSEVQKMVHEDQHPSPRNVSPQMDNGDDAHSTIASGNASDDHQESRFTNSTNCSSFDTQILTVSSQSASLSNNRASSCLSLSTSPDVSVSKNDSCRNSSAKVFKLNPGAEVFSPMSLNSRSLPATVPTIASAAYISNGPSIVPVATALLGVEINSFTSISPPAKMVQYDGLVTGHNGLPVQYSRPVIGHANAWQQPVRISGQFHPVQAGPAFVHPTPQTVMLGRTGQLVYAHPISQDAFQGASVFSQGSPHSLLSPCQTTMPKIQGIVSPSLQLCMAPPDVTAPAQPFAVPCHIPLYPPLPSVRPISAPVGNGFFGNKFQ